MHSQPLPGEEKNESRAAVLQSEDKCSSGGHHGVSAGSGRVKMPGLGEQMVMTKVCISWELMSQPRLPRKSSGGKSLDAHTLLGSENPGEQEGRTGERKYESVFPSIIVSMCLSKIHMLKS